MTVFQQHDNIPIILVSLTSPLDAASGVAIAADITATFSEDMDAATIDGTTFIFSASGVAVSGVMATPSTTTATFNPDSDLAASAVYIVIANGAAVWVLNGTAGDRTLVVGRLFSLSAAATVNAFATVTVPAP